jgi:DNA-binding transcriptional LysR family regulator
MLRAMNFRHLDLNLLRVFDVVMSERNLTRAASRLSLTQSAVSNSLKRLRESVGEDLLTRAAFGVRPTPRAEALWPAVRRALAELDDAFTPGEFDPGLKPIGFRIATGDAIAATLMPALVAQIETSHALANLRVLPLTTREPHGLLERGEADLAVGHFPETIAGLLAEGSSALLRHQRLYESEYVCVMRRGHLLAQEELTLDRFCAAHHLLVSFAWPGRSGVAAIAAQPTHRPDGEPVLHRWPGRCPQRLADRAAGLLRRGHRLPAGAGRARTADQAGRYPRRDGLAHAP